MAASSPAASVFALLAVLTLGGCEELVSSSGDQAKYDLHYVAALNTAREFCRAWQRGDAGTGMGLLSSSMLQDYPHQRIQDAIAPPPNIIHEAFELADGQSVGDDRLSFRVRFFSRQIGQSAQRLTTRAGRIVVQMDPQGRWYIVSFPVQ